MNILLAEDDFEIANFLIRSFKREKITVDHVADGKEALRRLLKNQYNAIILDLLLPSMEGEEVIKRARQKENLTPIIVLTALQDMETKIRLLNTGADDFLVKPFSLVELVARVKAVVRRTQASHIDSENLIVKDLVLVPREYLVTRAGKKIKLRLKEFELLAYLMRHVNQNISRISLFENIWNYDAKIASNTVDSHVSLLRKKINQGFDSMMI